MSRVDEILQRIQPHDILVIGSLVSDISCTYIRPPDDTTDTGPAKGSSNPARISQCVGGVAHNIALAAHYLGSSVLLVSVVANDSTGHFLLGEVEREGLSINGIMVLESSEEHGEVRTGQYVGNYNHDKEFLFGMADVKLMLHPETEHEGNWEMLLTKARPKIIVLDITFSHKTIDIITKIATGLEVKVIIEPVSQPRSRDFPRTESFRSAELTAGKPSVDMITPNVEELHALLQGAIKESLVDEAMVDMSKSLAASALVNLPHLHNAMQRQLESTLGEVLLLLPYIPTFMVTLGSDGVLFVERKASEGSEEAVVLIGKSIDVDLAGLRYECLFEHFPVPRQLKDGNLVSVNGAGDSLVGAVAVEWLNAMNSSVGSSSTEELAWANIIEKGQWAAFATLQHQSAVSPSLRDLKEVKSRLLARKK